MKSCQLQLWAGITGGRPRHDRSSRDKHRRQFKIISVCFIFMCKQMGLFARFHDYEKIRQLIKSRTTASFLHILLFSLSLSLFFFWLTITSAINWSKDSSSIQPGPPSSRGPSYFPLPVTPPLFWQKKKPQIHIYRLSRKYVIKVLMFQKKKKKKEIKLQTIHCMYQTWFWEDYVFGCAIIHWDWRKPRETTRFFRQQ